MSRIRNDYEHDIDQCSVDDKALLAAFREKRSEWIDWLERDTHHNICDQVHLIMWNDAIYRSLNEARRFASANNPTAAVNGAIGEFIDRGYISTQILDICKITDSANNDPKKGVISLRRLLQDIRDHRHLVTRENFVSYDGLPYDYATAQQAFIDSLPSEQRHELRWVATKGPDAWGTSEMAHIAFDKLCGIDPHERNRSDLIQEDVFKTIDAWFETPIIEKMRTHRNKFIGHAADEFSRQLAPLDRLGLSLDEIAEAQRTVIRIATAIGSHLLYDSALGGVVPTPQFDVFENLEKPVVPAPNLNELEAWWHEHMRERDNWLQEHVDLITGRITPMT